jgi:hypothetical protein
MINHAPAHHRKLAQKEMPMFAMLGRSVLFAGVLSAALSAVAWSADGDTVGPPTPAAQPPVAMVTSPAADPGTADAAIATRAGAQAVLVGESQPTRAHSSPAAGRRYAGRSARVSYDRPIHRYSLMLGIGY